MQFRYQDCFDSITMQVSWNKNISNIYKIYFKKPGPLEHLGVHGHLMRLASLRRMFVVI